MKMNKKALITGITGQDGSYLSELLLSKGYEVFGVSRSLTENNTWRVKNILNSLKIFEGDIVDEGFMKTVLRESSPDEIYHLASVVEGRRDVFDREVEIINVNFDSTHKLLRAIKDLQIKPRVYLAGSSLMFGSPNVSPQDENTPFNPNTPYGIAKTAGCFLGRMYREIYGVFVCTGILFNHESPRRDPYFLPKKISEGAVRIKAGMEKEIKLGDLDVVRDWGYAADFAESMWLMLQQENPEDFVVGTGIPHTVKDVLDVAFGYLDMDWKKYVVSDSGLVRPREPFPLIANPEKARLILNWEPRVNFKQLIEMMVKEDLKNV